MFTRLHEFDFSNSEINAIPALNIEEIFATQNWKKENLTKAEKRDLKEGVKYLELVLEGKEIIERAYKQGIVSGHMEAVEAYIQAYKAWQSYKKTNKIVNFEKVLTTCLYVLKGILNEDEGAQLHIQENDLILTHQFFTALTRTPIKANYSNFP